jgi:FKBP-type peptidyl-prolyl cis-trans isomerase FkpA
MLRFALLVLLAALAAGCASGYGSKSGTADSGAAQPAASAVAHSSAPVADNPAPVPGETPPPGTKLHKLPSGLVYQDLVIGNGRMADPGLNVLVHYTGWLTDGTKFDSSRDRGQPYPFVLGTGTVIAGWEEGIKGMRVGGRRKLTIPPDLGYGARGSQGVIPPNATLIFDVELVGVK